MSTTIETNNINILKKIEHLQDINHYLHKKQLIDVDEAKSIAKTITDIIDMYSVETALILSNYFMLENNNTKRSEFTKTYNRFIKQSNIVAKMDSIYNRLKAIFLTNNQEISLDPKQTQNKVYKDIWLLMTKYSKIKITMKVEEVVINNICHTCNELMMVTGINEQSCGKCGRCEEAIILNNDDNMNMIESNNSKSGSYDPSKHCKYWIDRIQGHEISDMTDIFSTAQNIKEWLNKEKIKNIDYITCKLIRKYLRKCGKSSLNEHIPLIRKIITGVAPPQLTESESQRLNIYFIKIIKIYNSIKPPNKVNCPYHPYIIFKILEQILPDSDRKKSILSCIHLQSTQTLILNDRIWFDICAVISQDDSSFVYIATDRSK